MQITRQWRGNFSHSIIMILVKFSCFIDVAACVESFTKVFSNFVDCNVTICATHCWACTSCDDKIMANTVPATTAQYFQTPAIAVPTAAANDLFTDAWEKMVAKYCRGITAGSIKLHLTL